MAVNPRGERGGVALMMLVAGLVFAGVASIIIVAVVDAAVALARGRTAADAAALAAMSASPLAGGTGDAEQAALPVAEANGARLESTDARVASTGAYGWPLSVNVAVSAVPATRLVRSLLPAVTVRASAALAPPEQPLVAPASPRRARPGVAVSVVPAHRWQKLPGGMGRGDRRREFLLTGGRNSRAA